MNPASGAAGNVVFVTNQLKTLFYIELAAKLREAGFSVAWIATSRRWADAVRAAGAQEADILDVSRLGPQWSKGLPPSKPEMDLLARVEQAGRFCVNNMMMMDRELSRKNPEVRLAYVAVLASAMDAFLAGRCPDLLIGEPTWCIELLAGQLSRLHGARMFYAHTLRLPSERLGFIDTTGDEQFLVWRQPDEADRAAAQATIEKQNAGKAKPSYMLKIASPFAWKPHWLNEAKLALGEGNAWDISVPPLHVRAGRRLKWAWNAFLTKRFVRFVRAPGQTGGSYIFITLHVQPEASVDVWGAPFNNQTETIRALARIVPAATEILVKEHRAAVGCRSLAEYQRLAAIPGVRLIHPDADTLGLMRGARLIASPSGTASLEAAVMGLPSVCFGRISFGTALLRQGFDPYSLTGTEFCALLEEADAGKGSGAHAARARQFMENAIANSIPAIEGDPVTNPATGKAANLEKLVAGFGVACGEIRRRRNSASA